MKKDIEKPFLAAYQHGGVVHFCIDVIRRRYDLHYLPDSKPLDDKLEKYYNETLPNKIKEATEAFDDTVVRHLESPLIDEISGNLNECETMQEKERYLHTLIVPFNELSELLHPELSTKELFDNEQQKRLKMISERFKRILNEPTDEVERSLAAFKKLSNTFANRLDALCLQSGIDLLKLQKECGTYLKTRRTITDVDMYIGSLELVKQYIYAINTEPQRREPAPENLLSALQPYLTALQQNGFIEDARANPLCWKGTIKELNYFINRYYPNEPNKWEKTINTFVWNNAPINKKSISTAIDKYDNPPNRSAIIDNIFN